MLHNIYFAYSWYFGDILRAEAEKWLLIASNPSGTFLVRTSSSQKNSLSLSLRDGDGIKHYRIRRLDDGCYYIASRCTFQTLKVSQQLSLWGYTCLLRKGSAHIGREWSAPTTTQPFLPSLKLFLSPLTEGKKC